SLQELSHSSFRITPSYRIIAEYGPDHDKTFEVGLTIGDVLSTTGTGKSKKEAEQQAARKALAQLIGDHLCD
ncbi:MAG: putative dsRNA-binding protein, partial [Smithellaceae bacterium]|nr:putative dsRNA-binding protein [Smithellaceae bacterium]